MSPTLRNIILGPPPLNPYRLPGIAAHYSLDGPASDASYVLNSGNVALIADRSGNSAVNGLVLNGATGQYASTPDAAALDITGDIDIRACLSLPSWAAGVQLGLVTKYSAAAGTQKSYALLLQAGGQVAIILSANGTAAKTASATTQSTVATGFSAHSTHWVRATIDVDNGAGGTTYTYYTSEDGVTWTQLGTPIVVATTSAIFSGTEQVTVGAYGAGGTEGSTNGIIYRAQIYSGIAGTPAFDASFTLAAKLAPSFTESSVNAATVTINSSGERGARICGARDYVQLTAANQIAFSAGVGTADGSNDNLRTAPFSLAQNFTRISVISQSAWSSGKYLLDGASAANTAGLLMATGTPQINLNAGNSVAGNTGLAVGAVAVVIQELAGASSTLQINNGAPTTGDAGSATPNGLTLFASGAATAANFANGTFREEIVFTSMLDANTKRKIVAFYRRKYPAIAA